KTMMRPGAFVVTPSWTFHHHGHEGTGPTVWLDGLDIPIVALFNSAFREDYSEDEAPVSRPTGDSLARYGSGLLPVGHRAASLNSPVFNYPYARTREALHVLARGAEPDAHQGHLMRYVNPVDGGWAMPTMATMIRLLPKGFSTQLYRSSDSMVFVVVEGRGHMEIEGQRFDLTPHDSVVLPGGCPYTAHAAIGFIAPAIRAEWNLTPAQLAPLFGAGLAGLMAGAFLFGPLADKFGRKGVLIVCVLFFGLASLASASSTSLWELVILRFLTGLGLGGAMPNSVTLTSEYCPEKRRSFLVTTMFCGFTVGSALGGLALAPLVGEWGWRSVLMLGGILPLVLLPMMVWQLPESVRYLIMEGKGLNRVAATLKRIA